MGIFTHTGPLFSDVYSCLAPAGRMFQEVLKTVPESIKHTAGAFVMQKLLQWLTPQEVVTLGKVSVPHVLDLANDTKGLHFMLKLVDCLVSCSTLKQLAAAVAKLEALHISEADTAKCAEAVVCTASAG